MTPKDLFLEGTFWAKFWRPIRSRALLFTPECVRYPPPYFVLYASNGNAIGVCMGGIAR